MERSEAESLEYLIQQFRKVRDKKPIFAEALHAMEEQRGMLRSGRTEGMGAPSRGADDAPVTIVEFMDFECPPCREAAAVINEILAAHAGKVRLVFRNFPRVEKHPHAVKAAEAALCAHDQGRFWEYHRLLFQNQGNLGGGSLVRLAKKAGLETGVFQACLVSGIHGRQVVDDMRLGRELGVVRVPTFFVNGVKVEGSRTIEEFMGIIEKM